MTKELLMNKLYKLPPDFCRQVVWESRNNACGLSRFYRAAWRQKDSITYLIDARDVLYFESVDKQSFLYTESEVY